MNKYVVALLVGLCVLAPVAHAQGVGDMTEEQILERFNMQKTRGLSIAPVGGAETPETPEQSATSVTNQADTPVGFQTLPPEEQVNINISFDFDSAALREDQKPKLTALCGAMGQMDAGVFRILGHTDSAGPEDYNQRLSRLRAEEVKRFLVADCGIAPERLEAVGVGEQFPLVPDDPRADVNRRVEFQVLG